MSYSMSVPAEVLALIAVLPLAQREQYWAENIPSEKHSLGSFLHDILLACPIDYQLSPQLSQRLAQAIANELHSAAANSTHGIDYGLQYALPDMLCVLDVSSLGPIAAVPGLDPRLIRIITARKAL